LTDGPDGPLLSQVRDVPDSAAGLDPPRLTMPLGGSVPDGSQAKQVVTTDSLQAVIPWALCVLAVAAAVGMVLKARARPR
jgi:hypothetical protein